MTLIPKKPKESYYTDHQWQAIHQKNSNVLISAGAGSGKTSVLTERVLRILNEGIDINRLLILTFTKAASLEMKERIRKNLEKAIKNAPNPHLERQLELLDVSFITTFDSFCLYLVKKYNHKLGIKKDIQIGDDNLFKQQKKRIIQDLFQSLYEENNEDFFEYLRTYTTKSDEKLEDQLLFLSEQLQKYDLDETYLDTYEQTYYGKNYQEKLTHALIEKVTEFKHGLQKLNNDLSLLALESESGQDTKIRLENEIASLLSFEDLASFYRYTEEKESFKITLKTSRDDRSLLKPYLDSFKELLAFYEPYFSQSIEQHVQTHEKNKPHVLFLLSLAFRFLASYSAFQDHLGIYDFLSISSLSTKLLKDHEDIRNELKHFYHELLIDEFQDTSLIQNIFISQIENNNVFMVGDIKQSIYRFRDAKPELFQQKYDLFKAQPTAGIKIDLNQNFRSRKEILEDINTLFYRTMSPRIGGVAYDDLQALAFGNQTYEKQKANQPYGIEILEVLSKEELEDHEKTFKTDESQVFSIIKDIKDKMASKYQVLDSKTNQLRDVKFDDFVILIDRKSPFRLFKAVAEANQVPMYLHATEPFVSNDDVLALRSLLSLFYCFKDASYGKDHFTHDFLSVFRSYLFQINDQILHDSLNALKNHSYFDYKKVLSNETIITTLDKLNALNVLSETLSLDLFLIEVTKTFNLLEKALVLNQIEAIESRLFYLIDKAKSLSKLNFGLLELLEYFSFINEEDLDLDFQSSSKLKEGMVNVMTIHKSKGLEFSICYYPMLDKRWSSPNLSNFYFDLTYGIIMPSFDEGLTDNIEKQLHLAQEKQEMISERLRLFYVALTRAKELAILVANPPSNETFINEIKSDELVDESIRNNYNSFNQLVYTVIGHYAKKRIKAPYDEIIYNENYKDSIQNQRVHFKKEQVFNYKALSYKPKKIKKERYSGNFVEIKDEQTLKDMALGMLIHEQLERLDFCLPLKNQIDQLPVDNTVKKFLYKLDRLPFLHDLKEAFIYQEYEFIVSTDDQVKQGIIDLLIETNEALIVVDYKLKDINKPVYLSQLEGYKDYLSTKSNKPIRAYLYSLIDGVYLEV